LLFCHAIAAKNLTGIKTGSPLLRIFVTFWRYSSTRGRLPDAIIAATALVYDLVLISRNISDFKNIDGLQVIDPHSL
jgi:predicted nucleic acid-binding protein